MTASVSPLIASPPFPAWPFPAAHVYVWSVTADDHVRDLADLERLLSPDERERASRMRRNPERWIVARSSLRRILGGCLGRDPREIEFRSGTNDKPVLAALGQDLQPHFNLSHSGELVLIAVADALVGVDVEQLRNPRDLPALARHVLRADEMAEWETLAAARRTEGFLSVWTRKEAYLKARGRGLGGLRSVSVNVAPDEHAVLIHDAEDPQAVASWTLIDLPVDGGYRAALAVLGASTIVRRTLRRLNESDDAEVAGTRASR
jgi:4'-phosphopantetheinyl transferase